MQKTDFMDKIAARFGVDVEPRMIRPLGSGLINDTYIVSTGADRPDYVLQRINHMIFKDIDGLHRNIDAVTSHIRKKLTEAGVSDVDRRCLRFLPDLATNKSYTFDGENYWRMSIFIPDTETRDNLTTDNAYLTGLAFGEFETMLSDMDMPLVETIPDFHNMEFRLEQFRRALQDGVSARREQCRELIDALLARTEEFTLPERLYREGLLPKRACHCDTKLSNILFNTDGTVACVIDLDTVMPSFVFSDYGDFLRSATNTGKEDDEDLSRVGFNMDIYHSFTKGYFEGTSDFLTPLERELLPHAPARFAYMQCVRFLTDYLNGDVYYKIDYPEHNLVRAKAQYQLLCSIDRALRPRCPNIC